MNIDDNFLKPSDLLQLELKTLEYLKSNKYFTEKFSATIGDVANAYAKLKSDLEHKRYIFNFETGFEFMCLRNKLLYFHIGSVIDGTEIIRGKSVHFDYNTVSYCLSICKDIETANPIILRKFHFDYITKRISAAPGPKYHIQYAGELTPFLNKIFANEIEDDVLYSNLSEPRLIFMPSSLAIILDLIFTEFIDPNIYRFTDDPNWRGIIRRNESKLIKPYFVNCCQFLKSAAYEKKLFLRDYCHGR